MDTCDDIELGGEENIGGVSQGPVRKRIAIKLKPTSKDKTAAKEKKSGRSKSKRDRLSTEESHDIKPLEDEEAKKTVQFNPISISGPQEPTHKALKLKWNYKVNLLGDKVVDPLIHNCEKCSLPILIYGRMIPCKHVFCFSCAKKTEKNCPRCNGAVTRIEQSALGTVFVCTYGGTKHGVSGCHRTYLSQRDLQSHMAHRHRQDTRSHHEQQPTVGQSQTPQLQQQIPVNQLQQVMMSAGQHAAQLATVANQQQQLQLQQQQHTMVYNPNQLPPHLQQPQIDFRAPNQQGLQLQPGGIQPAPQSIIQQQQGYIQIHSMPPGQNMQGMITQHSMQSMVHQNVQPVLSQAGMPQGVPQQGMPQQQGMPPQGLPQHQQGVPPQGLMPQGLQTMQGISHQGMRLQQVPQGMPQGAMMPQQQGMMAPPNSHGPPHQSNPGNIQMQGMNLLPGAPHGMQMVVQGQQPPGSQSDNYRMMNPPNMIQLQNEAYGPPRGPEMGQTIYVSQSGPPPASTSLQQRFSSGGISGPGGPNVSFGGPPHNISGPFVSQAGHSFPPGGPPQTRTMGPPGHIVQQGFNPHSGGQFDERMGPGMQQQPRMSWGPTGPQHEQNRPGGPPGPQQQGGGNVRPQQFYQ